VGIGWLRVNSAVQGFWSCLGVDFVHGPAPVAEVIVGCLRDVRPSASQGMEGVGVEVLGVVVTANRKPPLRNCEGLSF
jgi:hypothetical protein